MISQDLQENLQEISTLKEISETTRVLDEQTHGPKTLTGTPSLFKNQFMVPSFNADTDVNARDNAGWTPLFEAIRDHKDGQTLDVMKLLVANGADVNARGPEEDGAGTALHNVASKAHYIPLSKVV